MTLPENGETGIDDRRLAEALIALLAGLLVGFVALAAGLVTGMAALGGAASVVAALAGLAFAASRLWPAKTSRAPDPPAHIPEPAAVPGKPEDAADHAATPAPAPPVAEEAAPAAWTGDAERLAQLLFRHAPLGLALVDHEGRIEMANPRFAQAFGGEEPQGRPLLQLVGEPARGELAGALEARRSATIEIPLSRDGRRSAELHLTPVARDGRAVFLAQLVDVTRHKRLEQQFVQAQKMQAVGQLAGGVAHDFNNLLTAIIGFCDLLLQRHGPGDPSFADIMHIKQNANRAANLVRQLLAFSRQQTLRPKVLLVSDVISDLANLLRRLIGETITLEIEHGRDVGAIRVDQGQIEQVIINLAVNARDAMPDGGRLTIRTRRIHADDGIFARYDVMPPGEYALIEVADTGVGIPEEYLDKIFEPFFTTKEVGKGTGLGLSTVYGIVKQTGGYIFVESRVGKGTTFRLFLPSHQEAPAERERSESERAVRDLTGRETILLVEDEDAVRLFAKRALHNKGYRVVEARSGEEALELVRSQEGRFDLVISDVVMPNMDGPTLAREIRSRFPDTPIIFISGYAEDVFRKRLTEEHGDIAFLPKPFSLTALAGAVKEALDRRRA